MGGTPQSTSRAALPAYDRKKSRNLIADPDSQLRMYDATKADARGRWWNVCLRKMVEIREEQYGFVAGKGTIDAIFILRQLQEK